MSCTVRCLDVMCFWTCHVEMSCTVRCSDVLLYLVGSTGAAGPRLYTIHLVDTNTDNLPKAHTWWVELVLNQSPTQWPPLTSRIDLCQRLTVLQDSCKMHLCFKFCFLQAIFFFWYIFSCDIKINIIIWDENTVWNRQYI